MAEENNREFNARKAFLIDRDVGCFIARISGLFN